MEKIQLKAFDRRRNRNLWFHFCYIPADLWSKYHYLTKANNLDAQIKVWLKQDFDLDIEYMDDIYEAKECIKKLYSETYPEVYLPGDGDRQGWTRVWLAAKITELLEGNHEQV